MATRCRYCGKLLRDTSKATCKQCHKKPYRRIKGPVCEVCGFVPVNPVQLDVHHKNGDHADNRMDNLQTVCANCHRILTLLGD